jgi:hypothetical protein
LPRGYDKYYLTPWPLFATIRDIRKERLGQNRERYILYILREIIYGGDEPGTGYGRLLHNKSWGGLWGASSETGQLVDFCLQPL